MNAVLWLLVLASGAAGLAYELLWMRLLALVFGVSSFAVVTVLAVFMGGLALGSALFGRLINRGGRPLQWYAAMEAGIGALGLASPFLIEATSHAYITAYVTLEGAEALSVAIKFVLASAVLLPPTILMGGTIPVLSRLVVEHAGHVGWRVGAIYAFNTLGAVTGCFLTGFVALAALGVSATLQWAVVLNLAAAFGALALDRLRASGPEVPSPLPDSSREALAAPIVPSDRVVRLVTWTYAATGFAALCYEVVWTRLLVYVLGQTTYAFTTMLTTFLFGVALGSFIFARLADRSRDPVRLFAVTQCAGAVAAIGVMPSIEHLMAFSPYTAAGYSVQPWWSSIGPKFLAAGATMLVPTLLLGGAFPIVSRIVVGRLDTIGGSIGRVYALNTLGAILGSVVAGFLLVPLFGVRLTLSVVTCVSFALGVFLFAYSRSWKRRSLRWAALGASAAFFLLNVGVSTRTPLILSTARIARALQGFEVLYAKEGLDASLAVVQRRADGIKELNINGANTAFTAYEDIQVHLLLGHLPMLFHPNPQKALIVGFGFGSTARAMLCYDPERVDCVELVRDEIETASLFFEQNRGVLDDPRLRLLIGDGRNHIFATQETYDAISFNAVHPRFSSSLYSEDFYRLCKERLSPNGTVCAWLATNAMTPDEYKMLVRTFVRVFPHATLWWVNPGHTVLVATGHPLALDIDVFRGRLAAPAVRQHLAEVNLEAPEVLLGMLLLNETDLASYTRGDLLHTDDRPRMEFPWAVAEGMASEIVETLRRLRSHPTTILAGPPGTTAWAALNQQYVAMGHVIEGQVRDWLSRDIPLALEAFKRARALVPGDANVGYFLAAAERDQQRLRTVDVRAIADVGQLMMKGRVELAGGRPESALAAFQKVTELMPEATEAHAHLGQTLNQLDRHVEAVEAFERALKLAPDDVAALVGLASVRSRTGDLEGAQPLLERAISLQPDAAAAYVHLGAVLFQLGEEDAAFSASRTALQLDSTLVEAHSNLGMLYARRGDFERAEREFLAVTDAMPNAAEAHNNLALVYGRTGEVERAEEALRRAIAIDGEYARAYVNLGALYAQTGRLDQAVKAWRIALKIDPSEPFARANLARHKAASRSVPGQGEAER